MAIVQINQDYTNHITQIIHPCSTSKKGGLFLGNQVAATTLQLLKKHRITCIITVAQQLNNKHKKISIADDVFANIHEHFEPNYQFIKKGLAQGNVLIHCKMGISRSASLVIAYLMRKYKCGFEKAHQKVKDRRSIVNPNSGFVMQLKQYDQQIKNMLKKAKN